MAAVQSSNTKWTWWLCFLVSGGSDLFRFWSLGRILRASSERRRAGRRWQQERDLGWKLGSSLRFSFPIVDNHPILSYYEALRPLRGEGWCAFPHCAPTPALAAAFQFPTHHASRTQRLTAGSQAGRPSPWPPAELLSSTPRSPFNDALLWGPLRADTLSNSRVGPLWDDWPGARVRQPPGNSPGRRGSHLCVFSSFLDWKSAATPLSLARTPSSPAEEEKLSEILEELAQRFK